MPNSQALTSTKTHHGPKATHLADKPTRPAKSKPTAVVHSDAEHKHHDGKHHDSKSLTSTSELRSRARQHIEDGAVTAGYSADREKIVKLLNDALATELVCVLRYRRHHFMASGIDSKSIAAEFLEHSNEEQGHADLIAKRIVQLGGKPDLNPDHLSRHSHAEYVEADSLTDMIKEDLIAERIAIDSYRELVMHIGDKDPTTTDMLKTILAVEEEHADELSDLLADLPTRQ